MDYGIGQTDEIEVEKLESVQEKKSVDSGEEEFTIAQAVSGIGIVFAVISYSALK